VSHTGQRLNRVLQKLVAGQAFNLSYQPETTVVFEIIKPT